MHIIIDTDPGQDDAIAILLAMHLKGIEILGITCVSGNVDIDKTTKNARKICELAGRPETKVFRGCRKPIVRDGVSAADIHGECGMEGAELPEPLECQEQTTHAVQWMYETLNESSEPVTLCCLGPLTNVATLLCMYDIAHKIDKIVMMGGCYFERGNITPSSEFNVYTDPEAFSCVLRSGINTVILPLDVTHQALMSEEWLEKLKNEGTKISQTAHRMLTSYGRRSMTENSDLNGGPIHDPMVIAYLSYPEIFSGKEVHVDVETQSNLSLGSCIVDWYEKYKNPPNAKWINHVDGDAFFKVLLKNLV